MLRIVLATSSVSHLTFNHFGILGLSEQPATLIRLSGAACLVLGVILIRI